MPTSRCTSPLISCWPSEFGWHASPWTGMRRRSGLLPIWTTMMKLLPMWWPGFSGPSHMCMPAEPYRSPMPSPMLTAAFMRQTPCSSTLSQCRFPGGLPTMLTPDSRHERNGSSYAHGYSTGTRPVYIRTSGWNPTVTTFPTLAVKGSGKAGWFCL